MTVRYTLLVPTVTAHYTDGSHSDCTLHSGDSHSDCTLHSGDSHSDCTLHSADSHSYCTLHSAGSHSDCMLHSHGSHNDCTLHSGDCHSDCALHSADSHVCRKSMEGVIERGGYREGGGGEGERGLQKRRGRALDKWSHVPKKFLKNCSLWRQIFVFLFESEKSCFLRITDDYLSLLEFCVKNLARLELLRPFYACTNFVMEQQPY